MLRKVCLFILTTTLSATAAVTTQKIEYKEGDNTHEGVLAFDDAAKEKWPAVLVVHEWMGRGEHAENSARLLAEAGYVGFALDMYGKGKTTTDPKEASQWAGAVKSDIPLMRRRFEAALNSIRANEHVDPSRVAAIGYCFGGTTVLEMARSGLDLDGVVSFHGGLKSQLPADQQKISAKVLILHGDDDPHVPGEEVLAAIDQLKQQKADWQFVAFGNAEHSFTNPKANNPGARYEERAARRSWQYCLDFLAEVLK